MKVQTNLGLAVGVASPCHTELGLDPRPGMGMPGLQLLIEGMTVR